ncbi:MAG: aminotransferase class I/II-fold pyridoxal phosphate-dependent enzyme [Oscillospiraceae bacterium]
MKTPIYHYLNKLIDDDISRLHMPGHKGNHPYDCIRDMSKYDITEMTGADSLYAPDGIILQSEKNTAELYGAQHTSFSAGGSTLCIQTMLALVALPKDTIIVARNAHTAFINACALLDITPYWVKPNYNDNFGVSGEVTVKSIENAIKAMPNAKAVYITSPDYLGCMSDVEGIAKVCKKYHKPLVVDNAHGAHLKFTLTDCHPITLGATMCCDSAHKTLPVFTGGSYLHVSNDSKITKREVKTKMSLFGSTSPSYLILMSLDLNNKYLFDNARIDFAKLQETVKQLYDLAHEKGFEPISQNRDLTKLTLDAYSVGMTGEELATLLRNHKVECEYASIRHVVLMLSAQNTKRDIDRIKTAISEISKKEPIVCDDALFELPQMVMSVRQATFSNKELISIDDAIGKVAGETKIKCPPGVPIIIAGEIIDTNAQKLLKKSSIFSINVIK